MPDLGNTSVISPVDASNNGATMPGWNGAAAPSSIDDAGRALQGAVAREWENRSFPTATGTAPAFVVAYTVAPAALRSGQTYTFTAHAAAVGTDTINANMLGAKGIKKVVSGTKTAIAANDWYANDKIMCVYDGTDMVWVNWQGASASAVSANSTTEVLTGTDTTKFTTADSLAALWEQGADVASAGTISLGDGGYFNITGTTTITDIDFATDKAGRRARIKFAGALLLTHNASTLILPGGANITTAAGDTAEIVSEGSDVIRVTDYQKASGLPVVSPTVATRTLLATLTTTSGATQSATGLSPASYHHYEIEVLGVSWSNLGQSIKIAASGNNGVNYGTPFTFTVVNTGAGDSINGYASLYGINGTTQFAGTIQSCSGDTGGANSTLGGVVPKNATGAGNPIDALQFSQNGAGTFDAGQIKIYGVL